MRSLPARTDAERRFRRGRILGANRVAEATADDWADEFLPLKVAVRVVPLDAAIDHIAPLRHRRPCRSRQVPREVDAAAVVVDASMGLRELAT